MKDLYTIVTNRIIAALEQGTPPWVCPWRNGSGMPSNLVTNKSYRGINVLVLSMEMEDRNYADNRWLTFRQADQIGVRIRKGEHGVPIIFYRMREIGGTEVDGVDADTTKRGIPMLKSYTVFNATQLDGIPDRFVVRPTEAWQPIIEAEQIITKTGAVIRHGQVQNLL